MLSISMLTHKPMSPKKTRHKNAFAKIWREQINGHGRVVASCTCTLCYGEARVRSEPPLYLSSVQQPLLDGATAI